MTHTHAWCVYSMFESFKIFRCFSAKLRQEYVGDPRKKRNSFKLWAAVWFLHIASTKTKEIGILSLCYFEANLFNLGNISECNKLNKIKPKPANFRFFCKSDLKNFIRRSTKCIICTANSHFPDVYLKCLMSRNKVLKANHKPPQPYKQLDISIEREKFSL